MQPEEQAAVFKSLTQSFLALGDLTADTAGKSIVRTLQGAATSSVTLNVAGLAATTGALAKVAKHLKQLSPFSSDPTVVPAAVDAQRDPAGRPADRKALNWEHLISAFLFSAGISIEYARRFLVDRVYSIEDVIDRTIEMNHVNLVSHYANGTPKVQVDVLDLVAQSERAANAAEWAKYGKYLSIAVVLWHVAKYVAARTPTDHIGARFTTWYLSGVLTKPDLSSSAIRQIFVDCPMAVGRAQQNHTHGLSASTRNAGGSTAELVATSVGLSAYFVQMSLADGRRGRDGDRSFHWAKDIAVPPSDFHFDSKKQAAVLVDVDYYINMPELLAQHPGTYLISTFQPTAVAVSTGEYTFRFLSDDTVEYRVSGGAEYKHQVWNYKGDTTLVKSKRWVGEEHVAYHIDRKKLDDHHALILLTVIGKYRSVLGIGVEGKELQRLKVNHGDHNVLDVIDGDGIVRSVSPIGSHTAVTMPKRNWDAVHAVGLVAKVPLTPAMAATNIGSRSSDGLTSDRLENGHAAIIAGFVQAGMPHHADVVYPVGEAMKPIYFGRHDYDCPIQTTPFGSPLVGPCYGFVKSIHSDDRCICGRVEAFHELGPHEIAPTVAKYLVEFVERLIPVPHILDPLSDEQVAERQTRPSQRSILLEASLTGENYSAKWSSFNKNETYGKAGTDPRNISTSVAAIKMQYARYTYSFTDTILGTQKWYAFNCTPKECAQRIADILRGKSHAVLADGNRYDGHVKRPERLVERAMMLRSFKPQYHAELNESMDAQIGIPGTTREGRKYFSGYGRGSGSQETSPFNSAGTAFTGYCARRETLVNGVRTPPDVAWAELGIYGGDDSLESDVDPESLRKAAANVGQDYEITVVRNGELGVEFLNRQFGPDIWTGDLDSMANPRRLLEKLWTGPTHLADPIERFAERLSGYYRMDGNSPIIGDICKVGQELLGEREGGILCPWDGDINIESNWPNAYGDWMLDCFAKFLPDFDHGRFWRWLTAVQRSKNKFLLLKAPLCTPAPDTNPEVKTARVVGDELLVPCEPKDDKGKEEEMEDISEGWELLLPGAAIVETAEKNTPLVGLDGKREGALRDPSSTAARQDVGGAVRPGRDAGQRTSGERVRLTDRAGKPAVDYSDTSNWVEPQQKKGETGPEFAGRLAAWVKKRDQVATRKQKAPPSGVRQK